MDNKIDLNIMVYIVYTLIIIMKYKCNTWTRRIVSNRGLSIIYFNTLGILRGL